MSHFFFRENSMDTDILSKNLSEHQIFLHSDEDLHNFLQEKQAVSRKFFIF